MRAEKPQMLTHHSAPRYGVRSGLHVVERRPSSTVQASFPIDYGVAVTN
jgi:hypothetical protein